MISQPEFSRPYIVFHVQYRVAKERLTVRTYFIVTLRQKRANDINYVISRDLPNQNDYIINSPCMTDGDGENG